MRRYLQFRLRTLFVVTTLAALLAWIVPPAVGRYREYCEKQNAAKIPYFPPGLFQSKLKVNKYPSGNAVGQFTIEGGGVADSLPSESEPDELPPIIEALPVWTENLPIGGP